MKSHDHDRAPAAQRRPAAHQAEHGAGPAQLAEAGPVTFDRHVTNSPRMVAQRQLISAAFGPVAQRESQGLEEELPVQGKALALQQSVQPEAGLDDEEPAVLAKPVGSGLDGTVQAQIEAAADANLTGMPNQLKSGVEALSGMDMSEVRVHRNSDKPAQLNALAYAQGNEIHLGPGQEQHLPHEAWHVVQQRQGRVQATMQMAGMGVNDEVGLEREADLMGRKTLENVLASRTVPAPGRARNVVQAVTINGKEITAQMAMYKYFKFKEIPNGLKDMLTKYDSMRFEDECAFITVLAENGDYSKFLDKTVCEKIAREKNADIREAKMKSTGSSHSNCKLLDPEIEHAFLRHTWEGIKSAKKVLSASEGDVAVFPEGVKFDEIVAAIRKSSLKWEPRGSSGGAVSADLDMENLTVRIYGNRMGTDVSVETFFPLNSTVKRTVLEERFSNAASSLAPTK